MDFDLEIVVGAGLKLDFGLSGMVEFTPTNRASFFVFVVFNV